MITPLEYAFIFIISIIAVIYAGSVLHGMYSKRERGIQKSKRKRIGRKHDH